MDWQRVLSKADTIKMIYSQVDTFNIFEDTTITIKMRFLYTLLLAALSVAVMAQSNYHAGYVLKNNGDTLKGYINYREWTQSPKSIDFKINKSDKKEIEFTPQVIKGFQITGMETYISYAGTINTNKNAFPDLPSGLDTSVTQDTIFLKQVTTGRYLTLYYNSDELKTRLFIAEANAIPVELKYYVYYNGERQVVNSSIYNGQLLLYINKFSPGNNALISKAEKAQYDQVYLEPVVDEINNSSGKAGNMKKAPSSRFFVGLAINRTQVTVNQVEYINAVKSSTNASPKINLGIDLFNNPHVQQLIFRAELSLSYIAPRFNYTAAANSNNNDYTYEFNQYTAAITPQVLFNVYNSDRFKFYLDVGIAFNFSTYTNNQFAFTTGDVHTVNNPYNFASYWNNFPFQAGVVVNRKIEIYASYSSYSSYARYAGIDNSNQSINLGVKFLLNR